jgi:hypothetical protein
VDEKKKKSVRHTNWCQKKKYPFFDHLICLLENFSFWIFQNRKQKPEAAVEALIGGYPWSRGGYS